MSQRYGITLTLKQIRISKFGRRREMKPCHLEMRNYLKELRIVGEDGVVPYELGQAITNCMDNIKHQPRAASIAFHMQKFIKQQK